MDTQLSLFPTPIVVGLSGLAGSGKSVVADHLIEARGFVRVKFANGLKNMLRTLMAGQGADPVYIERCIEGDLKEVPCKYLAHRTPRHAMQTLGTEWGRETISTNFWADVAIATCRDHLNKGQSVVVDDLRFPNEFWALVDQVHASVWKVTRPGIVAPNDHKSEGLLDGFKFDAELHNGRTIDDLKKIAEDALAAAQC